MTETDSVALEKPATGISGLGLRGRTVLVMTAIWLVFVLVAMASLYLVTGTVAERLGSYFALRHVQWHKERLMATMSRELALARKMALSPLLQDWAENEENPELRRRALAELESFRDILSSRAWFVVSARTGHYFYNDAEDKYAGKELVDTVHANEPRDKWFFKTLNSPAPYNLNIDTDKALHVTKLWMNVAMTRPDGRRVGAAGTGVDLTQFVRDFVASSEEGAYVVLFDGGGGIQGHQRAELIDFMTRFKSESERSTVWRLFEREDDRQKVRQAMADLAAGRIQEASFAVRIEGRRHLIALTWLSEIDWYDMSVLDFDKVVGFQRFLPVAGGLAGALLVAILVIVLLVNRMVLTPLMQLVRSTQAVAAGNYDIRIDSDRRDEIGHLTNAFDRMAEKVRDYMRTLEDKVRARTEELQDSNRKITDGIRYASMIQSAVMPTRDEVATRLPDHFALWKPRDIVGGDFWFYAQTDGGFLLAVADCTGHGVPGAIMSTAAHSVLEQALGEIGPDDPGALLASVNARLRSRFNRSADYSLDNGLDLAVVCCDLRGGHLRFAGARIDLTIADAEGIRDIKGAPRSIGYRRSGAAPAFATHEVALAAGQSFYMVSDGYLDQSGGERGLPFGRRRFHDLVAAHGGLPMAEQAVVFERQLAEWQGKYPQRDDITLVGFRVTGDDRGDEA
ncbi:MAG: SpoIIE family protein phosphatase [Magnetospirillum sp. WYHS-4]